VAAHVAHPSEQALSQQKPSAQKSVAHSDLLVQGAPVFFAQTVPLVVHGDVPVQVQTPGLPGSPQVSHEVSHSR